MNDVLLWLGRMPARSARWLRGGRARAASRATSVGGFQIGTLLLGGTAAMVAGCLCLLLRRIRARRVTAATCRSRAHQFHIVPSSSRLTGSALGLYG